MQSARAQLTRVPLRCHHQRHAFTMLNSQACVIKSCSIRQLSLISSENTALEPLLMPVFPNRRSFAASSSPPPSDAYDPLARRPNKICDPYGQGGKPLSHQEAQNLLSTVHDDWRLVVPSAADDYDMPPAGLMRDFFHKDMMDGAQFVTKIAAVGTINNHYPSILLERRLLPKAWQVVTRVTCRTPTLEGLSYNDFYVAMVSLFRILVHHTSMR